MAEYAASKVEWLGAGLPYEGTLAGQATLGSLAQRDVATCGLRDPAAQVRARISGSDTCVVLDGGGVVLGLVHADDPPPPDGAAVADVMHEAPRTRRPHVSAVEVAESLGDDQRRPLLVTTLDGRLVGTVEVDAVRAAARDQNEG